MNKRASHAEQYEALSAVIYLLYDGSESCIYIIEILTGIIFYFFMICPRALREDLLRPYTRVKLR